jgi:aminoglycoside phosphotransferase (APT) family kinase protein
MGIPALQNYVEMYAKRLGLNEIPHLEFYFAYNFFRLAAILQGIVGRVRDGTATNADAAAMADAVRPLAGRGLDYAMKLR